MIGTMTYRSLLLPLLAWALLPAPALTEDDFADPSPAAGEQATTDRMTWWREAHLGMFIHYGLYSGLGGEFNGQFCGAEWTQNNLQLDSDTYARTALLLWNPAPGCAEKWAELAAEAGCRYVVLTTKHHEGFALFDTATTDFCAKARKGRDIVKEFAEACRARDLRVGFYHSVIDWHEKDYDFTIPSDLPYPALQKHLLEAQGVPRSQEAYRTYLRSQVTELLEHYGPVSILWWDYSGGQMQGPAWGGDELMALCREKQPGIIMNNRLFAYDGTTAGHDEEASEQPDHGDFITPEQRVPEEGLPTDWESCMTVGRNWGYNRYDTQYKSAAEVIGKLQECVSKGGNLLLNINPKGDGSVPEPVADVFRRLGAWMKINGESIYGARPVEGHVDLPEGLRMVAAWDDLYIYLPAEKPAGERWELRLPAEQVDTIEPDILGQPDCDVTVERTEEETPDGPRATLIYSIPTAAWDAAPEHMPVLRLSNAD